MSPSAIEAFPRSDDESYSKPLIRLGINGFGRIGRNVFKAALFRPNMRVVAINHTCASADDVAYLIHYDSTQGRLSRSKTAPKISVLNNNSLRVGSQTVALFSQRDPTKLDWESAGADYIAECTGKLQTVALASQHVTYGGAKKVLISAPSKDAPTFVFGVNQDKYDPVMSVVSCASCTTNCLAPVVKILDEEFGLEQGLMTTVHASTQSQHVLDGYSKRDRRSGRSVLGNIIPTTTGAAQAISKVLPQTAGKLSGISVRVPVTNVSLVDLTVHLRKTTTFSNLLETLREASRTSLRGVLQVCDEELVSCDFLGNSFSAVIDTKTCLELNSKFFKIVAWYDNEWAYSSRLLDMLGYMAEREI